jgi:quercetin dioxygenase-like cupin family protein
MEATHTNPTVADLTGWDIVHGAETAWVPWTGAAGEARAKVLGTADGYAVVLVEARPGYRGTPHVHGHAEFNYVLDGAVRNQGVEMYAGDGYAAAAGSRHDDFATDTGATYLVIFRI